MGALHDGHVSLVRIAKGEGRPVAMSIFVNPTQFGPAEDFSRYPRPIDDDLQLCRQAGVDVVFVPQVEEIYPPDAPQIKIDLPEVTSTFEGALRPGHFAGVCLVVAKLFNVVGPETAYFGEKDFQQLAVIRAMVRALNMPVRVVGCPTIRDADGLAMSSRNRYLTADQRKRGLSISRALRAGQVAVAAGERDVATIERLMRAVLEDAQDLNDVPADLQYAAVIDPRSFAPISRIKSDARAIIAMRVGSTRLIDNMELSPGKLPPETKETNAS